MSRLHEERWVAEYTHPTAPGVCYINLADDPNGMGEVAIAFNASAGERAARAQLIAAAPELLASLKEAADYLAAYCGEEGHCQPIIARASAAIAKAEGGAA